MRLAAEPKGDHFVLNGTKMWCTNGPKVETLVASLAHHCSHSESSLSFI
jgi:alkylation response protein AidB-like acyl-CoA dehydrogenase